MEDIEIPKRFDSEERYWEEVEAYRKAIDDYTIKQLILTEN